jgi:hypothetical protein
MAQPTLSRTEVRRRIRAIERALKAGYPPPGTPGKQLGAVAVAADALGLRRPTLSQNLSVYERHYGLKPDWSLWTPPETKTEAIAPAADPQARKLTGLTDRVRELESQLKAIHRDNLTAETVRRHIFGLRDAPVDPPGWVVSTKHKAGTAGVPCTMWSDWHWGEVVVPAEVNGINEFDIAIAQRRARALVEKTIRLAKHYMVGAEYPGIVINLGGDMLSGDIHEELTETNELPSMSALLDLFGVLVWALGSMAEAFGRIFVPCVPGNHGRNTRKPRFKRRAHSNFDWLLYNLLERHFQGDKRVSFYVPSGADAYYSVAGRRFLLTHGDNLGVKGGDGIIGSLGPILRGDFKIRNANTSYGQPYDTLIIGHWHQYLPLERVIVNGSLKGYDEFAKLALRAAPETPRQALWFVHPEHGVTCHWPVNVEAPRAAATAAKWVELAA